ncbi:enoyl-CoA hydratase-related protein [Calditerricola satsumensis]|uniref:Enoyl-CoA hydratase n=1 Tax=Calditerricola satsumensis TaxID=373054 RepID=A0A8J3FA05_9BACI|nr:enoyl-CoA hydratase-related protein [Calditerricola satsumensis]GGJ99023.1 enoyl-CoA hydratase [Calditerricola satsumensis]
MYETIRVEQREGVAVVTLSRPDKLNAVTPQMHKELLDAFKRIARDDAVRAAVLTGEGRAFCAGQDLETVTQNPDLDYGELLRSGYNPIIEALTSLEKPVVAAVNGVAAGAGVSLALACDLKLASDKASFVQAFVHIGLVPDSGSTWFLPRLVGLTKAMELALLGDKVSAEEAARIGLINRVVPHDALMPEALTLAERLAQMPTRAIALTKRAFYKGLTVPLSEQLAYEAHLQAIAGKTEDHREGVRAFFEKRKPVFRGR